MKNIFKKFCIFCACWQLMANNPLVAQDPKDQIQLIYSFAFLGLAIVTGGLLSYKKEMNRNLETSFELPDSLTPEDLPRISEEYATKVGGFVYEIHRDNNVDWSHLHWSWCRQQSLDEMKKHLQGIQNSISSLDLKIARDRFCQQVLKNFVEPRYCGRQMGNCGEAGDIYYCMAHIAGIQEIYRCSTHTDHAFALYYDPKERSYCVMDRWNLGWGHHFCGVSLQNGTLIHPKFGPSENKWYHYLTCGDRVFDINQYPQKYFFDLSATK